MGTVRIVKSPRFWLTFIAFALIAYVLYAVLWNVSPTYADPTGMAPARLPYCVLCSTLQLAGLAAGIALRHKQRPVAMGLFTGVLLVSLVWLVFLIQIYTQPQ